MGRELALTELRTLTARLLIENDISLAEGEDGWRLLNESKDHFSMSLAPLDLVFSPLFAPPRKEEYPTLSLFKQVQWR